MEQVCACVNFRRAARCVTQFFDEALQPIRLRSTQLVILVAVCRRQPVVMADLASELLMDRSTLTRNLRPLMRRGLLKIVAGQDRRTRWVALTARGTELLAQCPPLWRRSQDWLVAGLGKRRWQELLELMQAVTRRSRQALGQPSPTEPAPT